MFGAYSSEPARCMSCAGLCNPAPTPLEVVDPADGAPGLAVNEARRRVMSTLPDMTDDYTPRQVFELLTAGDIQLIDVRTARENEAGRIAGGRLIELVHLSQEASTIDASRPIIFYCRTGARSAMATDAFVRAGYDAHNMTGGLVRWHAEGLPIEPDDGHVADS